MGCKVSDLAAIFAFYIVVRWGSYPYGNVSCVSVRRGPFCLEKRTYMGLYENSYKEQQLSIHTATCIRKNVQKAPRNL